MTAPARWAKIAECTDDDRELDRVLALYRSCCEQSGVEPLDDEEARELARRFYDLLAPAFKREFRLH